MENLIIYCSDYKKNTEKIAQIFADTINCDLVNISDIDDISIDKYKLIGFGSGVYKESLSPKLFKFANELNLEGKKVFVFSTSGIGMKFYNKSLISLLKSKGAIVKGSFACKGSFIAREFVDNKIFAFLEMLSKGHPNSRDFMRAKNFIEKLGQKH